MKKKYFAKALGFVRTQKKLFVLLPLIVLLSAANISIYEGQQQRRWWQRRAPVEPAQIISTTVFAQGVPLEIIFERGRSHNHPLMAIWVEDMEGNYVQTLYVAESIGKGVFLHGDPSTGRWQPGAIRRPAALPYWSHQRGIQYEDGLYIPTQNQPMPDAITGPTPKANFILKTQTPVKSLKKFRVLMEINQSWDWNQYWHNNKFPDDIDYKTSSQPSVVYEALVELDTEKNSFEMKAIGHGHWAGKTGELFKDLSTLTTALQIVKYAAIKISENK
jgi:hypothetical protein